MGKNSPYEVDENTAFFKTMFGLRTEIDNVYELVKLLEKKSIDKHDRQSLNRGIYYVIKFLEEYCKNDDDYEFMLATYGFLKGFEYSEYTKIGERGILYWKYACKYEKHGFIKASWDLMSVSAMLKKEHKNIIGYLDRASTEVLSKNNGKLGLIDTIPLEVALEFPSPRRIVGFSNESSYENGTDIMLPIVDITQALSAGRGLSL